MASLFDSVLHPAVRDTYTRGTRTRHALMLGLVAALGVIVLTVLAGAALGWPFETALLVAGSAAGGAILLALLILAGVPVADRVLGRTTRSSLLEFSSPSHPLLRRLLSEAPGTYSHSMLAASLAESAAEAIGADQLLARIGAYYHDVGKLARPVYFSENQSGPENPHDSESPSVSARIITQHVYEGVDLARSYGLPNDVLDIIRQHHGDSLVACFYSKAADSGAVAEDDFRYKSERPRTREAALVMLADSAEAAVRCVRASTPPTVESVVRRVVESKERDGQLIDSGLSDADVETVVSVYARLLASIYHRRTAYPETAPRRAAYASQHHQPSRP